MRLGREVALRYEYEGPSGMVASEALVFEGVEAFRCTYHNACDEWALKAYCRIVEVLESGWAQHVALRLRVEDAEATLPVHLAIYFDDGPCYEFVCRSFRVESKGAVVYPTPM
jgi:hypothetical protein